MIGMATQNAARGEPRSSPGAVSRDCFAREVRAARIETAIVPEQRAQRVLITAQQHEKQGPHWLSGFTSASISSLASKASERKPSRAHARLSRRMISNRSTSGRRLRTASRRTRLNKFRSTARRSCFAGMMKPTHPGARIALAAITWRCRPSMRRPSLNICANAAGPRRR